MNKDEIYFNYYEKEEYYIVLFTIDSINFYSLVDKETCEPFVIKTLTHGFTDTLSYDDDFNYKDISRFMSVNYYELYVNIKSFFISLNTNLFNIGVPNKEGWYIIKYNNSFIKKFISNKTIEYLKNSKELLSYSLVLENK